jgi:hypothetical protein
MMRSLEQWKQHHNISSDAFSDLLTIVHNDGVSNSYYTTPTTRAGMQGASPPHVLATLEPSLLQQIALPGDCLTEYCVTQPENGFRSSSASINYQSNKISSQKPLLGETRVTKCSRGRSAQNVSCARCWCWKRKVRFFYNAGRRCINRA